MTIPTMDKHADIFVTDHVPPALIRKAHETKARGYAEVVVWGTRLIELEPGSVAATRDLDENTWLDLDSKGRFLEIKEAWR